MPASIPDRRALAVLAEENRKHLPPVFFEDLDEIETALARGQSLTEAKRSATQSTKKKGVRGRQHWEPTIRDAILTEFSILLCTDDPKYSNVRSFGRQVSTPAVKTIAAVVAGVTIGPFYSLVVGAAAFIGLAIGTVAVESFCRLNPPPGLAPALPPKPTSTKPPKR